jgi:hypothetical protein
MREMPILIPPGYSEVYSQCTGKPEAVTSLKWWEVFTEWSLC